LHRQIFLIVVIDNSANPVDEEEDGNEEENEIRSTGLETAEPLLF